MRFPPSFLDQIRARVNVSSIVGRHVQWDRRKTQAAKGDFWACCPFHAEKSPSFHADDRKGRYHCFGCKASGDVFTFLVEKEGVPFPEAVERLAGDAGLPMPTVSDDDVKREKERASLYDIMEMAQALFVAELQAGRGAKARGYLSDRDLSFAIQKEFGIGYAPDDRGWLRGALASKDVQLEQMIEAGLVVSGDDIPVAYDRFRDRVMFPIRDGRGRVIAFGGRALSKDVAAKYLNSPETPIFHKGHVLYNFDKARRAAHHTSQLIAVEGYVDVIAMHRAGFTETVAPLGTALTEDQLALLWKTVPEPVLCFDGDAAGQKAAYRALDLALPVLRPGHSLRFAFLPQGLDPDDLLRTEGADAVKTVIATASPMADVLWNRALGQNDRASPERKASFEKDLRQLVGTIGDETVRRHYQDDLRQRFTKLFARTTQNTAFSTQKTRQLRISTQQPTRGGLRSRLPEWQVATPASPQLKAMAGTMSGQGAPKDLALRRERLIVLAFINHPDLLHGFWDDFAALDLSSRDLIMLRAEILDLASGDQVLTATTLKARLADKGHGPILDRLAAQAKLLNEWSIGADAAAADAEAVLRQMFAIHHKAVTLDRELKQAELVFGADPTDANLNTLVHLRDQLSSVAGSEASLPGFGAASGRAVAEE
jgi:DNA primase